MWTYERPAQRATDLETQNPRQSASVVGAALALLVLAGCAGSAVTATRPETRPASHATDGTRLVDDDVRDRLLFEVDRWLGSEYRWGGTDRSGFDCSGFTRRVFRDAFDSELPRTTRQQMRTGSKVGRSDLRIADLVFFRTSSRTDHVGVYLGGGEFAHASTSSGVMISHLDERYWSRAYSTARRVLRVETAENGASPPATPVRKPERTRTHTPERLSSARVGW